MYVDCIVLQQEASPADEIISSRHAWPAGKRIN